MGIVAIGDSLVDADESWAHWLSLATGHPLERLSAGGSRSADVVEHQLPRLTGRRYAVACLTIGTNDILFDWDADAYAANLAAIVAAADAVAERVLVATISRGLAAFPGSGTRFRRRVGAANAAIRACEASVVEGEDLRGPRLMGADRVHLTVAGQLALADRAAQALGRTRLPSTLDQQTRPVARGAYHRVGVREAPRRLVKQALGRPLYRRPD